MLIHLKCRFLPLSFSFFNFKSCQLLCQAPVTSLPSQALAESYWRKQGLTASLASPCNGIENLTSKSLSLLLAPSLMGSLHFICLYNASSQFSTNSNSSLTKPAIYNFCESLSALTLPEDP